MLRRINLIQVRHYAKKTATNIELFRPEFSDLNCRSKGAHPDPTLRPLALPYPRVPIRPLTDLSFTTAEIDSLPPRTHWSKASEPGSWDDSDVDWGFRMAPKRQADDGLTAEDWKKMKFARQTKARVKKLRKIKVEMASPADVEWLDIVHLLGEDVVKEALANKVEYSSPYVRGDEVEVEIVHLCSSGKGIALAPESKGKPWALLVPMTFPGETVRVRVFGFEKMHSTCDLLEVIKPNPEYRDQGLVRCKYFGKCGGCQYQMLSYDTQLKLKRETVVSAYTKYSMLESKHVPLILPTIASPLQYNYRTKLTPHFPQPRSGQAPVPIGFNGVTGGIVDIEECVIATRSINEELARTRNVIHAQQKEDKFKNGVTLLFRDTLKTDITLPLAVGLDEEHFLDATTTRTCYTNNNQTVREIVDGKFFEFNGGTFFQNNGSILKLLIDYTKDAIFPPGIVNRPTHLIDTYCGAGLFSIMLSDYFEKIAGIELQAESIMFAKRNARLNRIPSTKIDFRAGDSSDIFKVVSDFPAAQTAIVIDPPRKGTDEKFMNQLVTFMPQTIVYVSCNVHTQARDIGTLMRKMEERNIGKKYSFESVRGFDLFPQTSHVESVAILRLIDT